MYLNTGSGEKRLHFEATVRSRKQKRHRLRRLTAALSKLFVFAFLNKVVLKSNYQTMHANTDASVLKKLITDYQIMLRKEIIKKFDFSV